MGSEESLNGILEKKLSIEDFAKWINSANDIVTKQNILFNDYLRSFNILKDEYKANEFFRYCYVLASIKNISNMALSPLESKLANEAEYILNSNRLGPICFVTSEVGQLGKWTSVGGLGKMVDDLSQALASLGLEIIIISPYYNQNKDGNSNYLDNDPFNFHYIKNISINLDEKYEFGVHHGFGCGIKYYFIHNATLFPYPYPSLDHAMTIKEIACFGKASLQLLCDIKIIPSIILTNDWFTGLVPAYGKNGSFGGTFKGTTFIHICHNLEPTYEGRLYLTPEEGNYEGIYQFDPNWLIDFSWKEKIINPSRCAIMMSDQWATVSDSYKNDLKNFSPLNYFLNQKPHPFSYQNGVPKQKQLDILQEKCGISREECKKLIQQRYFGYENLNMSIPVFSFIGRITYQKGIGLLLDATEEMIKQTNGQINILIGGKGNKNDTYAIYCANKMNYLRRKYPNSFWAAPDEYFNDGLLINKGSDFGLIPSLYEPGGIVQHEFFIAGTPVIAFRTGGLKDTVFEFNWNDNSGNGFTFESFNSHDLVEAIKRAINLYNNKEKYNNCRRNAFNSVIDVAEASKAWYREFCRLKNKIYFNIKDVIYTPVNNIEIKFDNQDQNLATVSFTYRIYLRSPKNVLLCGSFDGWKEMHPLHYDEHIQKWICTLKINRGKYFYKYIVDDNWEINPSDYSSCDNEGVINNVIVF